MPRTLITRPPRFKCLFHFSPAVSDLRPVAGSSLSLCYTGPVYAQKFRVTVVIAGNRQLCPLDWLDGFCMRNFTNSAEFDDTLPTSDGSLEASYRVTPERLAEALAAWLTKRGKGHPVAVEIEAIGPVGSTTQVPNSG
ncbi:MAG TPA: hypothetical protein VOA41_14035 [Candidatus Dormibacteraeota bacterium]|nr:hypothetical protein [Candidatus Dormibacteraeota bacterium]